ncbi:hypothetical protein COV16_07380, partial [Candidatus Woesearchaeota archaeon CG10_big_fil_rev_8_21_14_0_10_34_8]
GSQQFVHDTYKDFYLAQWFANKILLEQTTITDVFEHVWTYQEEPSLWRMEDIEGIDWRAVLPAWWNCIEFLQHCLPEKFKQELASRLVNNFLVVDSHRPKSIYNPFISDFQHCFRFSVTDKVKDFLRSVPSNHPEYLWHCILPAVMIGNTARTIVGSCNELSYVVQNNYLDLQKNGDRPNYYKQNELLEIHQGLKPQGYNPKVRRLGNHS